MAWPKGKPRVTANPQVIEQKGVDITPFPHGTFKEQNIVSKVFPPRKFSDELDHQGAYHPLCHQCNHREDMHHAWQLEQVLEDYRDHTGRISQHWKPIKHKVFDGPKPCQHACKCTEYQ